MRKLVFFAASVGALYGLARWWRGHRRIGTDLVNRSINPWLERHGLVHGSRGELGVIEHVGRKSGTVRWTTIHPMPIADGFRIIVPVGEESQWARNVLAAGHCRLQIGERRFELDEPVLQTPAEVPGPPRVVSGLFGWLGFRYLRLHTFGEVSPDAPAPGREELPMSGALVPEPWRPGHRPQPGRDRTEALPRRGH